MATTHVEIVAPERNLFSGEAEMVVCRAEGGDIAFLADHMPYLAALEAGEIRVDLEGGAQERFVVSGGFVQVHDNRVIMLVVEGGEETPVPTDVAATDST
ncbi:MAG TPA: F0F1 ATP synthase subunit epsilon [Acidimicrobiales bacterium]|nr:F0F1 ATP synthase subunit epsilon [Acidimicrobiales bacterium]